MELGSWALISPSILGLLPCSSLLFSLCEVENLKCADYQRGFRCYFAGLGSWNAGTSG